MSTLLLLDGNSLTYRAFFALPTDMATASGQVTNAVYGFTSMLINLLRDHRPTGLAVAWDRPEPTFRHLEEPAYKAQREAAPDILRQQFGLVRQVCDVLQIPMIELAGFEADDIIATLATEARDRGDDVVIVTGDRDTYQLVEDPHVKVLYNRRGVSDYAFYDEAGIKERTGVTPMQYPEYAAMRGDPSDNLPGVPGVGEKTAAKLINTYGDLDGIFANLADLSPKLRENLGAFEDQVRKNVRLMVLDRAVPIDLDVAELTLRPFDGDEVRKVFNFLEFRTLYDRLVEAVADEGVPVSEATGVGTLECDSSVVATEAEAVALLRGLRGSPTDVLLPLAAAWTGAPGRSPLAGIAFVTTGLAAGASGAGPVDAVGSDTAAWIPGELLARPDVLDALRVLVAEGGRPVATHGAKALMRSLLALDVDVRTLDIDTEVACYLLDPADTSYLPSDLLLRYVGLTLATGSGQALQEGMLDLDGRGDDLPAETGRIAAAVSRLAPAVTEALTSQGVRDLYDSIERPLVRVLARMEHLGVAVDADYLRELNGRLATEATGLEIAIQEAAGRPFKVNSTPQLREVLFDELGLAPQKKTKTGYSTDASSLEKLKGQHPIIEMLLRYREVEKLRSTYGEGLIAEIAADGRIHANFTQTVARTGRLSSDQPNLHNIPVRTDEGRQFRRAFVPAPGYELLVADYNQIELRVIAHLADDPGLVSAFTNGEDIHTTTAARVFGVDGDAVRPEQRAKAKMVSYGLAYGMEAYGLAQRLSIPVPEAAEILDAYFIAFPNVKAYMERTVAEARQRGYTETMMGRRRPIPELSSPNFRIRQAGERQAMNAGIQGLAADIFKVALVRLDQALEALGAASRLILQVHDEVILEVPPAEHHAMAALVRQTMADACELCVPLEVNLSFGTSWATAK
jgi:DNA polymerase I